MSARRALELDENVERLDLDAFETSDQRKAQIEQAAAAARAEAVSSQLGTKPRSGPKGGRPPKPGSRRDVERRTGIKRSTQARVERHVALAQRFPFLRGLMAP